MGKKSKWSKTDISIIKTGLKDLFLDKPDREFLNIAQIIKRFDISYTTLHKIVKNKLYADIPPNLSYVKWIDLRTKKNGKGTKKKFTEEQTLEIRRLRYQEKMTLAEIREELGLDKVSLSTICRIAEGRLHADIPNPYVNKDGQEKEP